MNEQHRTNDEPMGHTTDPHAFWVFWWVALFAVSTVALVVGLQVLHYNASDLEHHRKVISQAPEELSSLKAEQQRNLNTYGVVSAASELYRIPIDRAVEIVGAELAQQTRHKERAPSP